MDIKAVIQAGGMGTRLQPYTLVLPKPLMPVGGEPVLELLLKWLRRNGIQDIFLTTGYLGKLIKTVCGDGSQWDMNIAYTDEPEPLGTMGPLTLLGPEKLDRTFLVLNGDLITDLSLHDFLRHHREHGAMVTVATTHKEVKIDLGVLDTKDNVMTGFREKPVMRFTVSMGIYCMEPEVLQHIPKNILFGFDDLMLSLLDKGIPVSTYQHSGLWLDIGRPDDFQRAQTIVAENTVFLS